MVTASSSKPITRPENTGREDIFCPFLGYEDDPETMLAYPAPYNFCHHCKPIAPVILTHQRVVCLTPKFNDCPVYKKENLEPLPKGLRGKRITEGQPKSWLLLVSLVILVLAGLAAGQLFGVLQIPGVQLPGVGIIVTKTPEIPTIVKTVITPTLTPKPTETLMPTETEITISPFRTTPRALETPFGSSPQLVIHKVLEGEGYIRLAEKFGTTVDAIKAINFELPASLWVNTILVIPLNTDDVSMLPQFSVRQINTEGLTIEAYAQRMQLDAQLLKKYNVLPDGYVLKMGELIIIPN